MVAIAPDGESAAGIILITQIAVAAAQLCAPAPAVVTAGAAYRETLGSVYALQGDHRLAWNQRLGRQWLKSVVMPWLLIRLEGVHRADLGERIGSGGGGEAKIGYGRPSPSRTLRGRRWLRLGLRAKDES